MNINQISGLIPTSFTCEAQNEKGEAITETVGIKLRRMAFRAAARQEFQTAMLNADKDPTVIGELLAGTPATDDKPERLGLLAEWDVFTDEANTSMLPITVDNIIDRPVDFVLNLSSAVMERLFPNPPKAANLVNTSEAAERSVSAEMTSESDTTSPSQQDSGE